MAAPMSRIHSQDQTRSESNHSSTHDLSRDVEQGNHGPADHALRPDLGRRLSWQSGDMYVENESQNVDPWASTAGQDPQTSFNDRPIERDAAKPRPAKRPRKRPSDSAAHPWGDLTELENAEFEDPGRDFRAGAVFVHPPPGTAQACIRCHRIKRKCDQAKPRCAGCGKADVACVYELNISTSNFVQLLKKEHEDLSTRLTSAQDRVARLEAKLQALSRGDEASQLDHILGAESHNGEHLVPNGDTSFLPASSQYKEPSQFSRVDFAGLAQQVLSIRELAPKDNSLSSALPPLSVTQGAIADFFDRQAISYPLIDRTALELDVHDLYERLGRVSTSNGHSQQGREEWKRKETLILLVVAIGLAGTDGELHRAREYLNLVMPSFQAAVHYEDLLSVQFLTLLAIYGVVDPSQVPVWHALGFAIRQATALNLPRSLTDKSLTKQDLETRKRVYWSLHNLDVAVSCALHRLRTISTTAADVPLPNTTDSGSRYYDAPQLEVMRHVITLRRIQGDIYALTAPAAHNPDLPTSHDHLSLDGIENALDVWLRAPHAASGSSDPAIVGTMSWRVLKYHQSLCMLHRPSPLHPTPTLGVLNRLFESSATSFDIIKGSRMTLFKTSNNDFLAMSDLFISVVTLLYSICELQNRSTRPRIRASSSSEEWVGEMGETAEACLSLMDEAGSNPALRAWDGFQGYKDILENLADLLKAKVQPTNGHSHASNGHPRPSDAAIEEDQPRNGMDGSPHFQTLQHPPYFVLQSPR